MKFLQDYANGLLIKQIADKHSVSVSYVDKVLRRHREQLNAKTLAHAVYKAAKSGLICILIMASVFEEYDATRRVREIRVRAKRECVKLS